MNYFSYLIIVSSIGLIFSVKSLSAQEKERSHKSRHEKEDTTGVIYSSPDELKKIEAYGSLRLYMGISYDGYFGVEDGASRIGIKGKTNVIKNINAFILLELGVNGVDNNPELVFHGDPGRSVYELNNTITSRLYSIGFETPLGNISWGKQWSPYYDVGGFTDLSLAFGAEAQGSFPCNSDGGLAGTGRAANSLQIRTNFNDIKIGLQAQFRDLNQSDVKFADTYAASLIYANSNGISLGIAYNKVLDGGDDTIQNLPPKGDEAAIAGLYLQKKGVTIGATFSVLKNHESDDKNNYFDGNGYELFILYEFHKKWSALSGMNYLKPYGNAHGDYQIKYFMIGLSYYFTKTSLVFLETKIEDSKNVDGSRRKSILGFGIHYDF